jgi:hypothetical protein
MLRCAGAAPKSRRRERGRRWVSIPRHIRRDRAVLVCVDHLKVHDKGGSLVLRQGVPLSLGHVPNGLAFGVIQDRHPDDPKARQPVNPLMHQVGPVTLIAIAFVAGLLASRR